jgi:hypothetical protein
MTGESPPTPWEPSGYWSEFEETLDSYEAWQVRPARTIAEQARHAAATEQTIRPRAS